MNNEGPGLERFRKFVEEVREHANLEDFVRDDVADLQSCAQGWKCCSPVRDGDKDPSFFVYRDGGWYDFGLGEGGDVFDYVERRRGCSFREAVDVVAARVGLRWEGATAIDPGLKIELNSLVERRDVENVLASAAEFYHSKLTAGAREHLRKTWGLTDETIDRERIGWAPGGTSLLDYLADGIKIAPERIVRSGLVIRVGDDVRDFFNRRLVFWYWRSGRCVYAIGRRVDGITSDEDHERAKYKKLLTHSDRHPYVSETIRNDWFAGEDSVRGGPATLVITEGITDCIAARQAGHPTISPVTTTFRENDYPRLVTLTEGVGRVVIVNDRDELADGSSPGIKGALKTAAHLYELGREVAIGELPSREDGKNDLALFLRDGGDLDEVIRRAKPYVEFLLDQIPTDLDAATTEARLRDVCKLVAKRGPVERESYIAKIAKRFKLGKRVARELVESLVERVRVTAEKTVSVRGTVIEDVVDHYMVDLAGSREVISSFVVRPKSLVVCELGTLVRGDVVTERGLRVCDVQFEPGVWASGRAFTRHVNAIHPSCQWTGSDAQVQGVLRLVSSEEVETQKGTCVIGRHETEHGPRWVWPGGSIAPSGPEPEGSFVFVPTAGSGVVRHVSYVDGGAGVGELGRHVCEEILSVNSPDVVLPALGWFFATPVKPLITRVLGHFPILFVWGSQGGGKTSTVRDLFLPMFGAGAELRPLSATETHFALIRALGLSNAMPLFFDEYKSDMGRAKLDQLHRLLRRAYGGEIEERGRADQSVATYPLIAPVSVAGESYPAADAAIRERLVCVNPNPNWLAANPAARARFLELVGCELNKLAAPIVCESLGLGASEVGAGLRSAVGMAERVLGLVGRDRSTVPVRVFDSLTVVCFGLDRFERFARSVGASVEVPVEGLVSAVGGFLSELLEGEGSKVKDQFDGFVEALSAAALAGSLEEGRHYAWIDSKLCLHLPGCFQVYLEVRKRAGLDDQTNGPVALKRTAREKMERGESYVVGIDHRVRMGQHGNVRCVVVDPERVPESLTFEPFPERAARAWGGSRADDEGDREYEN